MGRKQENQGERSMTNGSGEQSIVKEQEENPGKRRQWGPISRDRCQLGRTGNGGPQSRYCAQQLQSLLHC